MSAKTLVAGLVGGFCLCAAGAACADAVFLPGLYEVHVSYPGEGSGVETTRECLTLAEVQEQSLERRLVEVVQDASCGFSHKSIGAGRFAITGTCNNDGFRSTLKQRGTYSPTAMTMEMTMTMPGTAPVSMTLSSRRVAANCPVGTDND